MLAMCRPIVLMLIICGGTLMSAAQQAKTLLTLQNQATAGDPAAQESLCGSYYMGDNDSTGAGIPKDDKRGAFSWCCKAGAQGRVQAQFVASSILSFGGVPHDEVESTMWSARLRSKMQTYSALLALRYRDGQGVPKDTAQAIFWFRKAAAQGDSSSKDDSPNLSIQKTARNPFFLRCNSKLAQVTLQRSYA